MNKEEIMKSYVTKEEFINIINSVDFTHVKDYDISLIKSWIVKADETGEIIEIKPLYYNIKGE
jgi:hypothetical protein